MKKAIILFALLLVGAFSMTSCGEEQNASETSSVQVEMETTKATEKVTEQQTEKATEKPTQKATEKPTEKKKSNNSSSSSSKTEDNDAGEYEVIYEEVYEYPQEQPQPVEPQTPQQPNNSNDNNNNNSSNGNSNNQTPISNQGSFRESDMCISYGNAKVSLDAAFSSIKSKLGTPDSTQENPNCGLSDNGKGYVYVYGNMTINTYFKNNKEYVETIFVELNGNAKTSKNITVGSKSADVKKAYGTPSGEDDMVLQYNSGDKMMMFYLENGKVTGMFIGR